MGRLEDDRIKGMDLAMRAVGHARHQLGEDANRDVELVLVGVPVDRDEQFRTRAKALIAVPGTSSTSSTASPLGVVTRPYVVGSEELREELRSATLVVMPSRAEGYGLVGVEAIILGVPVLVSERSGLADHLYEEARSFYDLVVRPVTDDTHVDVIRWGDAIKAVLRDPEVAFDRARNLAKHMNTRVTWAMAAEKILNLVPGERKSALPLPPSASRQTEQARSTRDRLSVLVVAATTAEKFRQQLQEQIAAAAPHVRLWSASQITNDETADDALMRADAVLVLLDETSRPASHRAVRREIAAARRRQLPVLIVRAGQARPVPPEFGEWPVVDVTGDTVTGWRGLLRRLDELGMTEPYGARPSDTAGSPETGVAEPVARRRPIGEMPPSASAEFLDREDHVPALESMLARHDVRLAVLEGPAGIGRTAVLRRLYERANVALGADDVIYLSGRGHRWITAATLLTAVARVADAAQPDALDEHLPWRRRIDAVLAAVRGLAIFVLVDDADDLFDSGGRPTDGELGELLLHLAVGDSDHAITVIICMRSHPAAFLDTLHPRGASLRLDEGLAPRWARTLLRDLGHGDSTLDAASDAQLDRLCAAVDGHPRSLEVAAGLLRTSTLSIDDVVDHLGTARGTEGVTETLLRLVLDELPRTERRVLQALAVYGRPVPMDAVDNLLAGLVQRDSRRPLHRLTQRYLVRQRGGDFYLPPVPDGEFFLRTLPDRASASDGMDAMALWRRAAGWLHDQRIERPGSVDELWPHFGEIELFLRIGHSANDVEAYRTALELMDDVDEAHLTGWGQSRILAAWRERLVEHLDAPELAGRNLSWLVAARNQQDGHADDIRDLEWAIRFAEEADDQATVIVDLRPQLANALFRAGYLTQAAAIHNECVTAFRKMRMRKKEAESRLELAICRVMEGAFDDAEQELQEAWRRIAGLSADTTREIRRRLLHNGGWLSSQIGDDEQALSRIDRALDLAGVDDDGAIERGALFNARASVLLFAHDPIGALRDAGRAADIAMTKDDHVAIREAHVTRALALVVTGRLREARHAADVAAEFSSSPQALGALATRALVAYRLGDDVTARTAFRLAYAKADERFHRDARDYQMLIMRALTLCGLALLGDRDPQLAVRAYDRAFEVTRAPGVLRRARFHLGLFGTRGNDAESDAVVLAAVRDRTWPPVGGEWS